MENGAGLWVIMGYGYGSDSVTSSDGVRFSLIALSLSMAASSGHLQKASHRPPFRLHQLSTQLYCPATLLPVTLMIYSAFEFNLYNHHA